MALAIGLLMTRSAEAVPFTLTADLVGDFRAENPDNLLVHVIVTGDTTSNLTQWTIDLDSLLHPNLTLGGFFFNVDNPSGTSLTFLNVSPSSWSISSSTQNAPGSGGAVFEFRSLDPPGSSNNVTNSQNLTFTARLNGGLWTPEMLLNAPLSDGGGIPDPGAQLGAHLRSAVPCQGCSDSGFASGNFGGRPPHSVPEPTTLLLMGLGMAGVVGYHRRRS
jgi:hypothetical protein